MPTLIELKEQRAQIWGALTEIADRAAGDWSTLSAEDMAAYERGETDLDRVEASIARGDAAERHQARQSDYSRVELPIGGRAAGPAGSVEPYDAAMASYIRYGARGMSAEHAAELQARYQSVGSNGGGGYTVAPEFWARIAEVMAMYASALPFANVITTATGASLPWPTADTTGAEGEILADEDTAVSELDVTFGQRSIGAYTFSSKSLRMSQALLQDSAFDVEGYLAGKIGERLGRITNRMFWVGSGSGQPQGIHTGVAATAGRLITGATGQTTTITYDNLVDVEHKVDPAYRASGRCRFFFNDGTLSALRKLKDSTGRPLWSPSLIAGVPSTINGQPYTVVPVLPSMAANAVSVLFGDLSAALVIRQVKDMTMVRLDELYATKLQVGFFAWLRASSVCDDLNAVAAYKNAAS